MKYAKTFTLQINVDPRHPEPEQVMYQALVEVENVAESIPGVLSAFISGGSGA